VSLARSGEADASGVSACVAIFPGKGPASTAIRWIPRTDWKGVSSDPSGRVSSRRLHVSSLENRSLMLTDPLDVFTGPIRPRCRVRYSFGLDGSERGDSRAYQTQKRLVTRTSHFVHAERPSMMQHNMVFACRCFSIK
jgi:hypothetical protein